MGHENAAPSDIQETNILETAREFASSEMGKIATRQLLAQLRWPTGTFANGPNADRLAAAGFPTPAELQAVDQEQGYARLAELRWPDGIRCPRCGNSDQEKLTPRYRNTDKVYCRDCNDRFSHRSGAFYYYQNGPHWA